LRRIDARLTRTTDMAQEAHANGERRCSRMAIDVLNGSAQPTTAAATRSPSAEIAIGSPVACRDGRVGTLERVLFDPRTGRVHYLVVASGFPRHRDVVVPAAFMDGTSDGVATLKLSRDEFARLRGHSPGALAAAETAGLSVAPAPAAPAKREVRRIGRARAMEKGATVWCSDGPVGRVERVLLGANGKVRALVVATGRLFGARRLVPAAWVDGVDHDVVSLRATRDLFAQQPEYCADEAILADVRARLEDDDPIRALGLRHATITVERGHVTLSGHVPSRLMAHRMAELAQAARGVRGVEDRLVPDDGLEVAVAAAIGRSPLNRTSLLRVRAEAGMVSVGGVFPSRAAKEEALRIAATVPGVVAVREANPVIG
jgi:osmotically-inducible protein OsmY